MYRIFILKYSNLIAVNSRWIVERERKYRIPNGKMKQEFGGEIGLGDDGNGGEGSNETVKCCQW